MSIYPQPRAIVSCYTKIWYSKTTIPQPSIKEPDFRFFLLAKERRLKDKTHKICPGTSPFGGPCPHRPSTEHHLFKKAYRRKHYHEVGIHKTRSICPWHHGHIHFANIPDGIEPNDFYAETGRPPLVWGGKDDTVKMILGRSLVKIPIQIYQEHFAYLSPDTRLHMPLENIIWLLATSTIAVSKALEKKLHKRWHLSQQHRSAVSI